MASHSSRLPLRGIESQEHVHLSRVVLAIADVDRLRRGHHLAPSTRLVTHERRTSPSSSGFKSKATRKPSEHVRGVMEIYRLSENLCVLHGSESTDVETPGLSTIKGQVSPVDETIPAANTPPPRARIPNGLQGVPEMGSNPRRSIHLSRFSAFFPPLRYPTTETQPQRRSKSTNERRS